MLTPLRCTAVLIALSTLLSACGGTPVIADPQGQDLLVEGAAVTLVNLRPDPVRKKLSAVNYQQAGLIPRCTAVRFVEANDEVLVFENSDDGIEYQYIWYDGAAEDFGTHLSRVFGRRCDAAALKGLNALELKAIERAEVEVGMSKTAVLLAIGYPPEHRTPSLASSQWVYWRNRFNRFVLEFDGDRVSRIIE